jgi:hypothetical protein
MEVLVHPGGARQTIRRLGVQDPHLRSLTVGAGCDVRGPCRCTESQGPVWHEYSGLLLRPGRTTLDSQPVVLANAGSTCVTRPSSSVRIAGSRSVAGIRSGRGGPTIGPDGVHRLKAGPARPRREQSNDVGSGE